MSRVGRNPIPIPPEVKLKIEGNKVEVEGPKGKLSRIFHPDMEISEVSEKAYVLRPSDKWIHRSLHGLTRTLLANMINGVSKGFEKDLELQGMGYRVQRQGEKLILQVGYSHPVEVSPPPGISFEVSGNRIRVSGLDKETVGEVAAQVRRVHPPDHYKGKGIRYLGERIRLKPGKAGKAVGKKG
jgi:large subunit ribosomal protein L6